MPRKAKLLVSILLLVLAGAALTVPADAAAGKREVRSGLATFSKKWAVVKPTFEILSVSTYANIQLCYVAQQESDPDAKAAVLEQVKALAMQAQAEWLEFSGNFHLLDKQATAVRKGIDNNFSPFERVKLARASGLLAGAAELLVFIGKGGGPYWAHKANGAVINQDCASAADYMEIATRMYGEGRGKKKRAAQIITAVL